MIPVPNPIPEPAHFEERCRVPGRAWLAKNEEALPDRPRDFWSAFRPDLRRGFENRCGYLAMRLEDGHVDHFLSWRNVRHLQPELAYEWSNFRFVDGAVNSKKGTLDDQLLDPFEIQDDWFELELPTFILKMGSKLPAHLRAKAEFTLRQLDLEQGRKAVLLRWEWYHAFVEGHINQAGLERYAPLVARAMDRWRRDERGGLPDIPRPG